ncbi:hypothetical protein DICA4_F09296 [Diutina catenulata]
MPPRRYMVKLQLSQEFLKTLPHIPSQKTRLRRLQAERLAAANAAAGGSKQGSPSVEGTDKQTLSNFKINSGLKGDSTAGLTMNTIGSNALDRTKKPAKRWTKRPRQFKTFTGFKVKYNIYKPKKDEVKQEIEVKQEESVVPPAPEVAVSSPLVSEA